MAPYAQMQGGSCHVTAFPSTMLVVQLISALALLGMLPFLALYIQDRRRAMQTTMEYLKLKNSTTYANLARRYYARSPDTVCAAESNCEEYPNYTVCDCDDIQFFNPRLGTGGQRL